MRKWSPRLSVAVGSIALGSIALSSVATSGCGGVTPGSSAANDYDFRACQQQEELGPAGSCWKLFLIHHRDHASLEQLTAAENASGGARKSAIAVGSIDPSVVPEKLAQADGRPGDSSWDQSVRAILVGAYDRDGSGEIDSAEELDAIECESIYVLDDALSAEQGVPLYALYGFAPDFEYVGEELGFHEDLRRETYNLLLACGVGDESSGSGPMASAGGGGFGLMGEALDDRFESPAGSSEWDGEVLSFLVSAHDQNGSNSIDTESELRGIPCNEFEQLDRALQGRMSTPLFALYGFGPDYAWVGDALGFDETVRSPTFRRLGDCGLVDE